MEAGSSAFTPIVVMAVRGLTIAAKFVLTVYVARFLGLSQLGIYGLISGAAAIMPVVLGFGRSGSLGRAAARANIGKIIEPLADYFSIIGAAYAVIAMVGLAFFHANPAWSLTTIALLLLEHLQTDIFYLIIISNKPLLGNIVNFIRSGLWVPIYMLFSWSNHTFLSVQYLLYFWLAGCALSTAFAARIVPRWAWRRAIARWGSFRLDWRSFSTSRMLYLNDLANTASQYVDRYIIAAVLGTKMVGIYIFYWSIANSLSNLLNTGIIQIKRTQLVKLASVERRAFQNAIVSAVKAAILSALILGGITVLFVYVITDRLNRPELRTYFNLMWYGLGALILKTIYEVLGLGTYAYSRDGTTFVSGLIVLGTSVVLTAALGTLLGIYGVGIALVARYSAGLIFLSWWLFRNLFIEEG
jgi:O-antigen/teichoic acid export membrane protein